MVWSKSPAPVLLWLYNFYCVGFLRMGDIKFIFRALHGGYLRQLSGQWRGDETPGHDDTLHQNTGSGKTYHWQKSSLLGMDEWSLFISDNSSLSRYLLSATKCFVWCWLHLSAFAAWSHCISLISSMARAHHSRLSPEMKIRYFSFFHPWQGSIIATLHSHLLFYTHNFATHLFIWLWLLFFG